MPVKFGPSLSESPAGSDDQRSQLNNAIHELSNAIWRKGGFRFWHRRTNGTPLRYTFFCSQDKDRVRQKESKGLRDRLQMKRFSCDSCLVFTPSLLNRTLAITLRHAYHKPYENDEISEAVLEFIRNGHRYTTPTEIFRDIQALRIEGWESVTSHQVYYQWRLGNSPKSDPALSAHCQSGQTSIQSSEPRLTCVH